MIPAGEIHVNERGVEPAGPGERQAANGRRRTVRRRALGLSVCSSSQAVMAPLQPAAGRAAGQAVPRSAPAGPPLTSGPDLRSPPPCWQRTAGWVAGTSPGPAPAAHPRSEHRHRPSPGPQHPEGTATGRGRRPDRSVSPAQGNPRRAARPQPGATPARRSPRFRWRQRHSGSGRRAFPSSAAGARARHPRLHR